MMRSWNDSSNRFQPIWSAVKVEEIYTSGGDLHLELPTGEREASRELWVSICCTFICSVF